ncbi:hypothetical protein Hanom_Chr14g01248461 [Helianthus anomalus]
MFHNHYENDDDCSTVVSRIIVPASFKSNDSCLKFIQYVAGYYRFVFKEV